MVFFKIPQWMAFEKGTAAPFIGVASLSTACSVRAYTENVFSQPSQDLSEYGGNVYVKLGNVGGQTLSHHKAWILFSLLLSFFCALFLFLLII